jgi:hypothetical protein
VRRCSPADGWSPASSARRSSEDQPASPGGAVGAGTMRRSSSVTACLRSPGDVPQRPALPSKKEGASLPDCLGVGRGNQGDPREQLTSLVVRHYDVGQVRIADVTDCAGDVDLGNDLSLDLRRSPPRAPPRTSDRTPPSRQTPFLAGRCLGRSAPRKARSAQAPSCVTEKARGSCHSCPGRGCHPSGRT